MKSRGVGRVSPEGTMNSWAEGDGLGMWERLPGSMAYAKALGWE